MKKVTILLFIGIMCVIESLASNPIIGKWKLEQNDELVYMEFSQDSICDFYFFTDNESLRLKCQYFLLGDIVMIKLGNSQLFDEYFLDVKSIDRLCLTYRSEESCYKKIDSFPFSTDDFHY